MVEVRGSMDSPVVPAAPAVPAETATSYVDWPAIFAGTAVASAIAFVLGAFGTALGLSLTSPFANEGVGATGLLIAIAIWIVWVTASSFMAGGYLAGRLRRRIADATEHEVDVRDGAHGLVVWGVGVLVGAVLLASGTMTVARTTATAASTVVASGAQAVESDDIQYLVDTMFRSDRRTAGTNTASDEARRILTNAGDVSDDDRQYLAALVAGNTGVSLEVAEGRVSAAVGDFDAIEEEARLAADAVRKASIISAFVLAASLLIGAASAYWAAGVGGRHRDEHTVLKHFSRWR
jgi:hypothetical protein